MKWFRKAMTTVLVAGAVTVVAPVVEEAAPVSAHGDSCSWSPDSGPVWDFHNACHWHDWCYAAKPYGSGYTGRLNCDLGFLSRMDGSCRARYAWWDARRYACYRVADEYYAWVRAFGWAFW